MEELEHSKIMELAQLYRVESRIIKIILQKYESMVIFIEAYKNGRISLIDEEVKKHLRAFFDIDFKSNNYLDQLLEDALNIHSPISYEHFRVYSSTALIQHVEKLPQMQREVLEYYYGLKDGKRYEMVVISSKLQIPYEDVCRALEDGLSTLREMKVFLSEDNPLSQLFGYNGRDYVIRDDLSVEDRDLLNELSEIVFASNDIFYPSGFYKKLPGNIDRSRVNKIVSVLRGKMPLKKVDDTNLNRFITLDSKLAELEQAGIIRWNGLSAPNLLGRNGIFTVRDLLTKQLIGRASKGKSANEISVQRDYILSLEPRLLIDYEEEICQAQKTDDTLSYSVEILEISSKYCEELEKVGIKTIGQLIKLGSSYWLEKMGISSEIAHEIWLKLEILSQNSVRVKKAMEDCELKNEEKRKEYNSVLIGGVKGVPDDIKTNLAVLGIKTIGELINITEDLLEKYNFSNDRKKRILSFVLNLRYYYMRNDLEMKLGLPSLKSENLDSSILALHLSPHATGVLIKHEMYTIRDFFEKGGIYALKKANRKGQFLDNIWDRVIDLSKDSNEIEEEIEKQKMRNEESKQRYRRMSLQKLGVLPISTRKLLKRIGIKTIGELVNLPEDMLIDFPECERAIKRSKYSLKTIKEHYENSDLDEWIGQDEIELPLISEESLQQLTKKRKQLKAKEHEFGDKVIRARTIIRLIAQRSKSGSEK